MTPLICSVYWCIFVCSACILIVSMKYTIIKESKKEKIYRYKYSVVMTDGDVTAYLCLASSLSL